MAIRETPIGLGEASESPTQFFPDARTVDEIKSEGLATPPVVASNEYDQLVEAPSENEYVGLIGDGRELQKSGIKQSMFAARNIDPERQAKVLELSNTLKVPAEFVERNYERFASQNPLKDSDYDNLINKTPGLAKWLENPENAALSKDDLENLSAIEKSVNDYSYMGNVGKALMSGISGMLAGVSRLPAAATGLALYPYNKTLEFTGETRHEVNVPDWLLNNPVAKHYDEQARAWAMQSEDLSVEVFDEFEKGNYSKAIRAASIHAVQSVPLSAAALALMYAGRPREALSLFGGVSGAQSLTESSDRNITAARKIENATIQGAIEAGTEFVELRIFKRWATQVAKKYGKPAAREFIQGIGQTLGWFVEDVAIGASQEVIASYGQDLTDYIIGDNPDAIKGIHSRAFSAGASGAIMTGAMTIPSGAAAGLNKFSESKRAQLAKDFYLSLGKSAEATKLRERLPSKQKELVENITKGTDVENIYIPVQAMEAYFQGAKVNPLEAMQKIGVLDAYNEAKEIGSDVKIPLATWATEVVGTEHFAGLANDIKFDPGQTSVNEQKLADEEAKKDLEKIAQDSKEDKIGLVKSNIKQQLVEAGTLPSDADKQAQLYESAFRSLGERTGQDPLKLFEQYAVRIKRPDLAAIASGQNVLNQPNEFENKYRKFLRTPEAESAYEEITATKGGKYINQDYARLLMPEYKASREGKVIHAETTQKPSADFAQKLFDKRIAKPGNGDASFIIGGPGVGKTTLGQLALQEEIQKSDVVLDGVGANDQQLIKNIQSALKSGRKVNLVFAYRPINESADSVVERFKQHGRPVPAEVVTRGHVNSLESYLKIHDLYKDNPNVVLQAVDLSAENVRLLTADEVRDLRYIQGDESAQEAIQRLLPSVRERLRSLEEEIAARGQRTLNQGSARQISGANSGVQGVGLSEPRALVSPLGYYSKLESDIAAMDFKQIPANELANRIKNIPGIKAEELEWSGILDYLKSTNGPVKKEAVVEFIRENGVQVEQVVLGEEGGSSDSDKLSWGEEEHLDLDEIDPYGHLLSEEADYYLKESDYADEWKKEFTEQFANEYSDAKELNDAVQEAMEDRAVEWARERLEDPDSSYARFRVQENESGWTIEGSDDYGWRIEDERGREMGSVDRGGLEEAKIQAIRLMQEKGVFGYELNPVAVKDVEWTKSKPVFETNSEKEVAWVTKNLPKFIGQEQRRVKKYSSLRYTKKEIRDNATSAAHRAYRKRFDKETPTNVFEVQTKNPFFRLELKGSPKKGFYLEVLDDESLSTTLQAKSIADAQAKAIEYMREKGFVDAKSSNEQSPNEATGPGKYGQYTLKGGSNYREILLTVPGLMNRVSENVREPVRFTESHFSPSNVLAHIRTKDRTTAEGEKVLFVEEIQSDWHQKGRERGYDGEAITPEDIASFVKGEVSAANPNKETIVPLEWKASFSSEDNSVSELFLSEEMAKRWIEDHKKQWSTKKNPNPGRIEKISNPEYVAADLNGFRDEDTIAPTPEESAKKAIEKRLHRVPNAPFKNTEAWASLAFKRILSIAQQDGYAFVAWGPGQVHADRYNLSEHVDEVNYYKNGDVYMLDIKDKRGSTIDLPQPSYNEKDLVELLGKDVATKIVNGEGEKLAGESNLHTLRGTNLKIGGEGHKYFYDKVLPKVLQKHISKLEPTAKIEVKAAKAFLGEKLGEKSHEYDELWTLKVTPELKAKIAQGQTLFQKGDEGPRGQIRFGNDRQFNIDLLKGADMSTFLHETGHFYLEVLGDVAASDKATDQIKKDYQTLLDWFGVQSRDQIKVEQHEQFARAFEGYLMEGKAPSSALKKAFAAFRVWLTNVYRRLTSLNVELTPEVRQVFDRLLATEDEISAAEVKQNMQPLFMDPVEAGMSEAQAKKYIEARDEAREASEFELQNKILEDVRRKQTKEYKEKRAFVRLEAQKEVDQSLVFRSIDLLKGTEVLLGAPEVKLSKAEVVRQYSKEFVKRLPRGIFSESDGLHPDIAAEFLGFETGDSMLTQLANAPSKKEAVDQLTDQKMSELYPDLIDSEGLASAAMKAVHNDKRAQLLRLELEHLATNNLPVFKGVIRKVAQRVPTEKAVREQAAKIIGGKNIEDIKPYIFERAEARLAKEAGVLLTQGDIAQAFESKRLELLNHELYRAAIDANEEIEKSLKKFKKLAKSNEDLSKTRDVSLVNAARALLAQYGIGNFEQTALSYLESVKRYDPEMYETLLVLVGPVSENPKNYRELSYDEFLDLKSSVDALWDLSRSEKQIEIDGKKMDRSIAIVELSAAIPAGPKDQQKYTTSKTKWDKTKMALLGMKSALRRVESWVDAMDGGKIKGAFRKYLFTPVSESISRYREVQAVEIKKFLDLLEPIKKDLVPKAIEAPELGHIFNGKVDLLGALLHTGNESNFSKLLRGRNWGSVDEVGNLDASRWNSFISRLQKDGTLTKADYDFLQGVWDQLESLKPEAQKAHKAMYGYYFNEITAREIETPFGFYRGGYVPAVADPLEAPDQNIRNEKELLEKFNNSFMFPTTGRGFTKKRVDAYAAPLVMDLRLIPGHIDKVLRFSHIEPFVKQVGRIVMNGAFRRTLDSFDPTVGGDMLVPWLQRSAQQKIETPSQGWGWKGVDTIFKEIRKRTGLNIMVGNVINTLQNYTGFSMAAVKVKPRFIRNALWSYIKAPNQTASDIGEKSPFMNTRTSTQVFEIQKSVDEILLNPSKYEKAIDFAKEHGYFLQRITQNQLDLVTWSAAYDQAIEEGNTEQDAVRSADSAVRLTQGSFNAEDISRFETGAPVLRAFTMFYSYFNMQANLLGTEFSKVARSMGLRKGAGKALYIYTLGFMIPAVLSESIVRIMSGKLDDDDDDQYLDDAMTAFFQGQLRTGTAMFPVVGPAIQAGINQFNDKWYDDRITTSPAVSSIERSVTAPFSVYKAITENGSKKKAIQDSLTLLGLITGAPVAPLSRPLGYLSDVSEGKADPENAADFARGLITGKTGK